MDEKKTMGKSLTLFNSKFSLERQVEHETASIHFLYRNKSWTKNFTAQP